MPRRLALIEPRRLALVEYEDAPLKPDQVRAQAIISGISHGTELNVYRGTAPFHARRFDPNLRLFVANDGQSPYPVGLGYEWVGRVAEVGDAVTRFHVGDLLHLPYGHRDTQTFAEGECTMLGAISPLPPGLHPDHAIFLALAGVGLQAVHDGHVKLGDRVAIFGLGAIGLLTVQLARRNGAAWIAAVDPLPARRALAEQYGADRTFDPTAQDVAYEIKAGSPHRGVDLAIEVSGHYPALHEAVRSVRMAGVVVAAGYYQGGGEALRLGEEWHHNRVTMVSSMGVWYCPHRDHPAWDRGRVHSEVTDLMAAGRLRVDGMITHRIPLARAAEAYTLIDAHPEQVVKVALTY